MASKYQRFLKIIEEIGSSEIRMKYSNTLDAHLMKRLQAEFTHGESTRLKDPETCERTLLCLERLKNDFYKNKYPQDKVTTFTELPGGAENLSSTIDQLLMENAGNQKGDEKDTGKFPFFNTSNVKT